MDSEDYISFVVRIWREQSGGEQPSRWCGEIEQIQSGVRWCFSTLTDLLAFLQQAAFARDQTMPPGADHLSNVDYMSSQN
jgi:hypothetical protein